jgi:hypothetical protein
MDTFLHGDGVPWLCVRLFLVLEQQGEIASA